MPRVQPDRKNPIKKKVKPSLLTWPRLCKSPVNAGVIAIRSLITVRLPFACDCPNLFLSKLHAN